MPKENPFDNDAKSPAEVSFMAGSLLISFQSRQRSARRRPERRTASTRLRRKVRRLVRESLFPLATRSKLPARGNYPCAYLIDRRKCFSYVVETKLAPNVYTVKRKNTPNFYCLKAQPATAKGMKQLQVSLPLPVVKGPLQLCAFSATCSY